MVVPKPKVFKGIAFELIFFEILDTTSKGGGLLLAVNCKTFLAINLQLSHKGGILYAGVIHELPLLKMYLIKSKGSKSLQVDI